MKNISQQHTPVPGLTVVSPAAVILDADWSIGVEYTIVHTIFGITSEIDITTSQCDEFDFCIEVESGPASYIMHS